MNYSWHHKNKTLSFKRRIFSTYLRNHFPSIHIYVWRAFSWNKNISNQSTKSVDIGQNMYFPVKNYLPRKIRHFEKNKKKFHPVSISSIYFRSKDHVKYIHATSLSEHGFICHISLKISLFYPILQKLSNWNILHQYITLSKSYKQGVKRFFCVFHSDVSWHQMVVFNDSDLDYADILKLKIYCHIVHRCRHFCSIK